MWMLGNYFENLDFPLRIKKRWVVFLINVKIAIKFWKLWGKNYGKLIKIEEFFLKIIKFSKDYGNFTEIMKILPKVRKFFRKIKRCS